MESVIKFDTNHKNYDLKIESDNSTEYKNFDIECIRSGRLHPLRVNRYMEEGVEVLELGSVTLRGREVSLFKEFLEQKL